MIFLDRFERLQCGHATQERHIWLEHDTTEAAQDVPTVGLGGAPGRNAHRPGGGCVNFIGFELLPSLGRGGGETLV